MPKTKKNSTAKKKTKKGRRYPEGKYPDYEFALKQAQKNSAILNPKYARNINNSYLTEHPEIGIRELEGDPHNDNFYKQGNEWHIARIPKAKAELREVHKRFKNWQKEQVRRGKTLKPPTDWPAELLTLRLSREAILDTRLAELNELKKRIKAREDEKEKKRLNAVLENGPLGKEDGNMIDGQKISNNPDGVPFVDEPTSKYNGMPLYWYKKMSEKWKQDIGITNEKLYAERDEEHRQARKKAYEQGEELTVSKPSVQQMRREKLAKLKKDDFPEWPADAKPINEI